MTDLTLFFAPDSCARVSMIALEETEHPYKTELIAFMRGDHRSPRYLALNPKGRVPTLIVDGRVLTENVAILLWLAARFPEANLLPQYQDAFDKAQLVADLTLQPSVANEVGQAKDAAALLTRALCPSRNPTKAQGHWDTWPRSFTRFGIERFAGRRGKWSFWI